MSLDAARAATPDERPTLPSTTSTEGPLHDRTRDRTLDATMELAEVVASQQRSIEALHAVVDQLREEVQRWRPPVSTADGTAVVPAGTVVAAVGEPERETAVPSRPPEASDRRAFLRRSAVAAAAVAGGGAVLTSQATPAAASAGDPVILGSTGQTSSAATGIGLNGSIYPYGFGVFETPLANFWTTAALAGYGKDHFNAGVLGEHPTGNGVRGKSDSGAAVNAVASVSGWAVYASALGDAVGVEVDVAGAQPGVRARSAQAVGVETTGGTAALHLTYPSQPSPLVRTKAGKKGYIDIDTAGDVWACVADGVPGTWRKLAGQTTAGQLHVLDATQRVYDSRAGFTPTNVQKGALAPNGERVITLTSVRATAVLVNITIVSGSAQGFLAAFKNGIAWPGNSTINWDKSGAVAANSAVVACDASGAIKVRASNTTDLIIDVVGYYQ